MGIKNEDIGRWTKWCLMHEPKIMFYDQFVSLNRRLSKQQTLKIVETNPNLFHVLKSIQLIFKVYFYEQTLLKENIWLL
jgi:phage antirepressor YoqD-like protein